MNRRSVWKRILSVPAVLLIMLFISLSVSATTYDCSVGNHKYIEVENIPATATTDGSITRRCELCSVEVITVVYATNHKWGAWVTNKTATCTQPGESLRTCTTTSRQHHEYRQIPALGHDYKESVAAKATCETAGVRSYICSRCSDRYTKPIPATGHKYEESITKEPGCLEEGEKTFICANDSAHRRVETIPALGHAFGNWVVEKMAEENTPGLEARVCAHDESHRETREIPALTKPPAEAETEHETEAETNPEPETEPEKETNPAKEPFWDIKDAVIAGLDIGMLIVFFFLIFPYIGCFLLFRKQRNKVEEQEEERKAAAKKHGFK